MPTANYGKVLLTYRGLVAYRTAVARPATSSAAADSRTRSWVRSVAQVLTMSEQNPIRKKTDLVYLASIPARQVPDANGDLATLPPLRFFLTVDNQGVSSKIWVSNFEVADKPGRWEPLEKRKLDTDGQIVTLWLSDVDAMVSEMISGLSTHQIKP